MRGDPSEEICWGAVHHQVPKDWRPPLFIRTVDNGRLLAVTLQPSSPHPDWPFRCRRSFCRYLTRAHPGRLFGAAQRWFYTRAVQWTRLLPTVGWHVALLHLAGVGWDGPDRKLGLCGPDRSIRVGHKIKHEVSLILWMLRKMGGCLN